jgi:hypothetical protein
VGSLPDGLRQDAEMYAGCVAGAIQKDDYLGYIEKQGFTDITIQKEKVITIPDDILTKYLSIDELAKVQAKDIGIFSVTVFAAKPAEKVKTDLSELTVAGEDAPCCEPDSGCC